MESVTRVTTALTRKRLFTGVFVLLLSGFSFVIYWSGAAMSVTPGMLLAQTRGQTPPAVLDVRFGFEFARGHIPGAVNVPLHAILVRYEDLAIARDAPVVVYCGTGPRACIASFVLKLVGFEQVYILDGQFGGWQEAGLPVVV
jgi:rhodanese-related sulfurtransferase